MLNKIQNVEVSLIIPVYNVEQYLRECLDSVVNQTLQDIEIICVDDGSTDGSGSICDNYKNKYSNVIVKHQKNSGLSDARNAGIKMQTALNTYDPEEIEAIYHQIEENLGISLGDFNQYKQQAIQSIKNQNQKISKM